MKKVYLLIIEFTCFKCGKEGHKASECPESDGIIIIFLGNRRGRREITCFKCGKTGHLAKFCKEDGNGDRNESQNRNIKKHKSKGFGFSDDSNSETESYSISPVNVDNEWSNKQIKRMPPPPPPLPEEVEEDDTYDSFIYYSRTTENIKEDKEVITDKEQFLSERRNNYWGVPVIGSSYQKPVNKSTQKYLYFI